MTSTRKKIAEVIRKTTSTEEDVIDLLVKFRVDTIRAEQELQTLIHRCADYRYEIDQLKKRLADRDRYISEIIGRLQRRIGVNSESVPG